MALVARMCILLFMWLFFWVVYGFSFLSDDFLLFLKISFLFLRSVHYYAYNKYINEL